MISNINAKNRGQCSSIIHGKRTRTVGLLCNYEDEEGEEGEEGEGKGEGGEGERRGSPKLGAAAAAAAYATGNSNICNSAHRKLYYNFITICVLAAC